MTSQDVKRAILHGFSMLCRLPIMRGRITISEWLYRLCRPASTVVRMGIGSMRVELDLSEIESRYIYFSAYEREEVRFLRRWLAPGDVAIDVGAHVGYLSAVMASAVGSSGRVYALEPDPRNYGRLETLAASSRGVVHAYHIAVTDTSTRPFLLYPHPTHSMWSTSVGVPEKERVERICVDAISLDDFIALHTLARIDLVKIDVEGSEPKVLRGMQGFLATGARPAVLCELVPKLYTRLGVSTEEVVDLLLRHGYRMFTPMRFVEISSQRIPHEGKPVNVLFIPKNRVGSRGLDVLH